MRILRFQISRFGCFEDETLSFGDTPGFHIVYGSNEAGKSTVLRAIEDLLYGIPGQSPDNFRYSYGDMRLTAVLAGPEGELMLSRRKGNKNTLLDDKDRPVPEPLLAEYLCAVPRKTFGDAFGFDYRRVLEGRDALREGKGDLAESLFQTGTGITNLRAVLNSLEAEKSKLFLPHGAATKPVLNAALDSYRQVKKTVDDLSLKPKTWRDTKKRIEEIESELDEIRQERLRLSQDKARLDRFQGAFPLVSQHAATVQSLSDLNLADVLAESAIAEYERAKQTHDDEAERARELSRQIDSKLYAWGDGGLVTRLVENQNDINSLYSGLGKYASALDDRPEVSEKQQKAEREARELLQSVRIDPSLAVPVFMCLSPSERAAVVEFAQESKIFRVPDGLDLSRDTTDLALLSTAVRAATDEGQIEKRIAEERPKLEAANRGASEALSRLPLWSGKCEEAKGLCVPMESTVREFQAAFRALDEEIRDVDRDVQGTKNEETRLREERQKVELVRAVPTESELGGQRKRRDQGWALVRRSWLEKQPDHPAEGAFDPEHPLPEAYELTVHEADNTADRLRFEADRVVNLAQLDAGLDRCKERLDGLLEKLDRLSKRREHRQKQWVATWRVAGIPKPLGPAEMLEWLNKHETLVRQIDDVERRRTESANMEECVRLHREAVSNALVALGAPIPDASDSLAGLIARSNNLLEAVTLLKEFCAKIATSTSERRRVEQMTATIQTFEETADALLSRLEMPEVAMLATKEAVAKAHERLGQAISDKSTIQVLKKQRKDAVGARDTAGDELGKLASEAGCADLDVLDGAVNSGKQYYGLKGQQNEIEGKLAAYSVEGNVQALIDDVAKVDSDDLPGLMAQLDKDIQELDGKRDGLNYERGQRQSFLQQLDHGQELAAKVLSAESTLAEARTAAERYIRVHLASEILRMEIERYRAENQDPVLARASELFSRLTRGSFDRVGVDYGEKDDQVMVGIRPNGENVKMEGMSDGTRDELYVALRVASLEQQIAGGAELPAILDDVLIEFDDDRAKVALQVFDELSDKTQVLYFTHHRHVVDLAKETLRPDRVAVHELGITAGS